MWPFSKKKSTVRELLELSIHNQTKNHQENMGKLSTLEQQLDPIVSVLNDVGTQLEKARQEILAALGDVEIPAAAQAKLDGLATFATALKGASQALDDINPDASTT